VLKVKLIPARILLGSKSPFIGANKPNANGPEVIGPLWDSMSQMFFSLDLARDAWPVGVGAMWMDGTSDVDGAMIYFAGYEVNEVPEDLGGLEVLALAEGRYATTEHEGPMAELPGVISNFYAKVLPESGLERKPGIDLEIYYANEDPNLPPRVVIAAPLQA
jgi:predicted transcriptional regulator YdeE